MRQQSLIAIQGAGAVGLVIGARLARAGEPVLFITRREEAARQIEHEGVRLEDPASGQTVHARAAAVAGPEAAVRRLAGAPLGPVLLCVRTSQTEEAARALRAAAGAVTVVAAQNGVDAEEELARHFPRVIGAVVRQTCTRTAANAARALPGGRLVLGAHPEGLGADVLDLAGRLGRAGYDVGLSQRICEDKWLKLCINVMSAPNALVRRDDHATPAFVELKARLLEEAQAAVRAAGIRARSCDGRDRSLSEEIAHQRASLARGTSARPVPLYNQVWSALRHGGPLEADEYHRRILALARAHGLAAPANERVLAALERAAAEELGPESFGARELLGA